MTDQCIALINQKNMIPMWAQSLLYLWSTQDGFVLLRVFGWDLLRLQARPAFLGFSDLGFVGCGGCGSSVLRI